jgi:peptide/nickel transport system substrate-binding protein
MNNLPRFTSKNTKWEFNVDKANAILDAAGWKRGPTASARAAEMKFVYQTSINGTRQKEQAIVKQAAQKAGIDLELKSVTASCFLVRRR